MLKGFLDWLIGFLLRGAGAGEKRQPDAEAQDKRAGAVAQAARAEQINTDTQAAVAASGASNATVDRAADAAVASQRRSVSDPSAIDSDPAGHWRRD